MATVIPAFADNPAEQRQTSEVPATLLANAQAMIAEGRHGEAFEYLQPYEGTLAGDVNFNYLYGIAALDSGHPSEAIFAFQRVLNQEPRYSAARMELARAYFELGDYEAARAEFEALYQQEPPPLARTAIINYLSAIRRKSVSYRPHLSYYVQGGVGYDSNANGATDADIFLNFRLDERNVAQSSAYYEIAYGATYSHPINRWYQGVLYIGARHRRQPSAEFVDLDRVYGGAGLRYKDYRWDVTSSLVWSRNELEAGYAWDGEYNSSDVGIEVNLRRRLDSEFWRFVGNFRAARVDYRESISVQDVDQYLASAGFEWAEDAYLYRRIGGMLILGQEEARQSDSPYGRAQYGLRFFGSRQVWGGLWLLAQGGFLHSDYDGRFFGDERGDTLIHVVTALDWRPFLDPRWSVQPHVSYYNNNSDITLFDYDRTELGITLKWASE